MHFLQDLRSYSQDAIAEKMKEFKVRISLQISWIYYFRYLPIYNDTSRDILQPSFKLRSQLEMQSSDRIMYSIQRGAVGMIEFILSINYQVNLGSWN